MRNSRIRLLKENSEIPIREIPRIIKRTWLWDDDTRISSLIAEYLKVSDLTVGGLREALFHLFIEMASEFGIKIDEVQLSDEIWGVHI